MSLQILHSSLIEFRAAKDKATKDYGERMTALDYEITQTLIEIAHINAGLDVGKLFLAEHVLKVCGNFKKAGEDRQSVLADAIAFFATGGGARLKSEFLGTKDYDRWHGQRCDCEYGMGPRHGSIIFSIGLTQEARMRDTPLTGEEIEAALYYLGNLETIQANKVISGKP